MSVRRPLVAGNWKMHMSPPEAERFCSAFLAEYGEGATRVAVFPPALSLPAVVEGFAGREDVRVGVQNVHWEEKGAYTGEISAPMAAAAGAQLALVGHSERRHLFAETNEDTARKTRAVLAAGMSPLLCVGETLEEREAGSAAGVVETQLRAVYEELSFEEASRVLVAYEPVWAIGTGRTASPEDAAEMHGRIRAFLAHRLGDAAAQAVPILYGGSVKPENAAELLSAGDVDGLLVGGASLDPQDFARICRAAG